MAGYFGNRHHWLLCAAALAVWIALGWPFLQELIAGTAMRGLPVPALWLVPFSLFGAAVIGSLVLKVRAGIQWTLLWVQLAAVVAMAAILPSNLMSVFLIIIAWQVAMRTTPAKALGWVVCQTLAIIVTLAQAPGTDLSYIIGLSFVLQLSFVSAAQALRGEEEAARALAQANRELRSAQAIIANSARDAERLRISRELHDAWGHELTALGLQLEIASHVSEPGRANDHVMQAKGLARDLLVKVRDAVAALRKSERWDPGVTRQAKQAVASRPWPQAKADVEGVRLAAGGDGKLEPRARGGSIARNAADSRNRHQWIFCLAALAVWLGVGLPVIERFMADATIRGASVSSLWFVPFALFGAAVVAAMVLKLRTKLHWALLWVQLAAVAAMAISVSWAMMSVFLVILAWQVAMLAGPGKALGWVAFQTLAITGALQLGHSPDFCWVIGKSLALQLFTVFAAQALRREAETARALAQTNRELRSAQALIADTVRDAERLRISRELHDAWGHELTALGLQLEIASHVTEPGRANDHVMQAKGLARALLASVRDVVASLREAECCELKDALEALAQSVPTPAIHVEISPDVRVEPDQAHALMRCAQEAVTNAVKHATASNLWLQVTSDGDGVRLVARNDGSARPAVSAPGSGLLGMRERVESLGGRLAVRAGAGLGFTVDAWLPSSTPQAA
jgi:signal transduction histidine kinase